MSQVITKIRALFRGEELPQTDEDEPFAEECEQEWAELLVWAREEEGQPLVWQRPSLPPAPPPAALMIEDDDAEWAALAARAKTAPLPPPPVLPAPPVLATPPVFAPPPELAP